MDLLDRAGAMSGRKHVVETLLIGHQQMRHNSS